MLATGAASVNLHVARPPRLILIDAPLSPRLSRYTGRNDDGRRMVARASCEADLAARIQFSKILGHTAAIMPDPIPLSEVCLFRTRAGQGIA